jgi:small subunit ribosomal protein S13
MVFFMQQNLRPHVNVRKALTQIYGMHLYLSNKLCDQMGFSSIMLVKHLRASHVDQMARMIGHSFATGQELQRIIGQDIARFVRIGSYKGFRFTQGLPVRGQRTHTNARNARRKPKPNQSKK